MKIAEILKDQRHKEGDNVTICQLSGVIVGVEATSIKLELIDGTLAYIELMEKEK